MSHTPRQVYRITRTIYEILSRISFTEERRAKSGSIGRTCIVHACLLMQGATGSNLSHAFCTILTSVMSRTSAFIGTVVGRVIPEQATIVGQSKRFV